MNFKTFTNIINQQEIYCYPHITVVLWVILGSTLYFFPELSQFAPNGLSLSGILITVMIAISTFSAISYAFVYSQYRKITEPTLRLWTHINDNMDKIKVTDDKAIFQGKNGDLEYRYSSKGYFDIGFHNKDVEGFSNDEIRILSHPFRKAIKEFNKPNPSDDENSRKSLADKIGVDIDGTDREDI